MDAISPNFPGVNLQLKPGEVLVIYTDKGPSGISSQCMSITCPWTMLYRFKNEAEFHAALEAGKIGRRGQRFNIDYWVMGEYGMGRLFLPGE